MTDMDWVADNAQWGAWWTALTADQQRHVKNGWNLGLIAKGATEAECRANTYAYVMQAV